VGVLAARQGGVRVVRRSDYGGTMIPDRMKCQTGVVHNQRGRRSAISAVVRLIDRILMWCGGGRSINGT